MVVKLSSYLWLRNNHLVPMVEDRYRDDVRFMRPENKAQIAEITRQIDELHTASTVREHRAPIVGPNLAIPGGFPEIVERSWNPQRSGELFEELFQVLKPHWIKGDVYYRLDRAFEELGIRPQDPDLERVLEYARQTYGYHPYPTYHNETLHAEGWLKANPLQKNKERL